MERIESAVAFAGRIKSGKTTLARRVATELSLPFASFGDFVRGEAESRGLDCSDRVILQSVGQVFIDAGLTLFCTKVLDAAGWVPGSQIVVDGVRHIDVLHELQELLLPVPLKLVYVEVSDATQASRFANFDTANSLAEIESHATEADVKMKLFAVADIAVDANLSIEDAVFEVLISLR